LRCQFDIPQTQSAKRYFERPSPFKLLTRLKCSFGNEKERNMDAYRMPAGLRIGHVHLHVSNLNRSAIFYRDVMGFDLNLELPEIAFLSADGCHHHIGLNTWGTAGAVPDTHARPGLYHFTLNYSERKTLARAVRQLVDAKHAIGGALDHSSHIAIYISDPDGNGIELAWDRDPSFWEPWRNPDLTMEDIQMVNKPIEIAALIAKAVSASSPDV
jgi:catechol 2,3-dioxygenase